MMAGASLLLLGAASVPRLVAVGPGEAGVLRLGGSHLGPGGWPGLCGTPPATRSR